jgi:hypothetical protein
MRIGGCRVSVSLPLGRSSFTRCTGRWMGRSALLDKFGENKITCILRGSKSRNLQLIDSHYTGYAGPTSQ